MSAHRACLSGPCRGDRAAPWVVPGACDHSRCATDQAPFPGYGFPAHRAPYSGDAMLRFIIGRIIFCIAAMLSTAALAADNTRQPIHIIVPYAAGSTGTWS